MYKHDLVLKITKIVQKDKFLRNIRPKGKK